MPVAPAPIPDHPDQLVFGEIAFEPPVAKDHRVVLKNGMVVYIAEDRTLPLVNVSITLRAGRWLEPAGAPGIVLRRGDETVTYTATPRSDPPEGQGAVGIRMSERVIPVETWSDTFRYAGRSMYDQVRAILLLPAELLKGSLSPEQDAQAREEIRCQ